MYYEMTPDMISRMGVNGENLYKMDDEIRKRFKIPDNRYYSVTIDPSPVGRIFVDKTRTRVITGVKLSKSN